MQKKFVKTEETRCENCAFSQNNSKEPECVYCCRYPKRLTAHWKSFFNINFTTQGNVVMKKTGYCGEFLKKSSKQEVK
jgi:hypothetical protein